MTRIVPVTLVEEEEEHHRVLYFYIQTQRLSRMKRNQIIKNQQLLYIIYHRATTMRWACVCVCVGSFNFRSFARSSPTKHGSLGRPGRG